MHVVQAKVVGGSSLIGFPLVIADSEQIILGMEYGPLGWHTSALTNYCPSLLPIRTVTQRSQEVGLAVVVGEGGNI